MTSDEVRRRRCLVLPLALVFALLLPLVTRTWLSFAVGVVGAAVVIYLLLTTCLGMGGESERSGTNGRGTPG